MPATKKSSSGDNWFSRRVRGVRRRPHFSTAVAIFLVMLATLIGAGAALQRGMLLAFDISALIFLAGIVRMFSTSTIASIRVRAVETDGGRWGVLWSSVAVASVVLVALGVELHAATKGSVLQVVLAAVSLTLAWFFLNTMFALHYAHEFYRDDCKTKVLGFPDTPEPGYWDFAYFAFVVGMTFQVSDVDICDGDVRRIALAHGIIAFFFNVVILALSVNVVAGKV
jgi:uncharacterized membrane protein